MGVQVGSHEVVGKGDVFTKTSQMVSIGAIFITTYHTKQLNPWPNSSANHVVNYSWLSACQGNMQPFEGDTNTGGCRQTSETSHSKSSMGNFQHQYLPELLVSVYSYCLMVKVCLAVACMEAGFSQIRSHILVLNRLLAVKTYCTNIVLLLVIKANNNILKAPTQFREAMDFLVNPSYQVLAYWMTLLYELLCVVKLYLSDLTNLITINFA